MNNKLVMWIGFWASLILANLQHMQDNSIQTGIYLILSIIFLVGYFLNRDNK